MKSAFLSLTLAAPVLGISRQKLKIMAQRGGVPSHKEGGKWLIHVDEAVKQMKRKRSRNDC